MPNPLSRICVILLLLGAAACGGSGAPDASRAPVLPQPSPPVVTVFAGNVADSRFVDGVGSQARFSDARDITTDGAGNLYVLDDGGVRRVTLSASVTTPSLPGNNPPFPYSSLVLGIAADRLGDIHFAGVWIHCITFPFCGPVEGWIYVATQAGDIVANLDLGEGAYPLSVALDDAGNTYWASDNAVSKVDPAGHVRLLAGDPIASGSTDGIGNGARFNCPSGLAVDPAGNVLVFDAGTRAVRRISPSGAVTTIATIPSAPDATCSSARAGFNLAKLVIAPDGRVFLVDGYQHVVWKINADGSTTIAVGAEVLTRFARTPVFRYIIAGSAPSVGYPNGGVMVGDTLYLASGTTILAVQGLP